MTIHPLPPQAYTKDTLIKAFDWLQSQDESIKQIATSPDVLVSLYMKAQMQGEDALHRPSIKNFKSDLKQLANMMGQWEESLPGLAASHSPSPTQASATTYAHSPQVAQVTSSVMETTHKETRVHNTVTVAKEKPLIDDSLLEKVQEVQKLYGLSTESEAIRLIISVGYHHAKRLMS